MIDEQLARQYKFGFTVRNKQRANDRLKFAIDAYMVETFGIVLPETKTELTRNAAYLFDYDAYGDSVESRCSHLVNLRYALTETKGYYAEFQHQEESKLVPLSFWYSKHRLCHVWNWRKSQIIRSRYYNYLQEAKDSEGRLVLSHYQPVHLVLTVPHSNGMYNGKRFYAKDLIKNFTALRKNDAWKSLAYSGEYGLEVKRSEKHGLHIHLHVLLFQHPEKSVNECRELVESLWRDQTQNQTAYSGIHYETLYTWQQDETGAVVADKKGVPQKRYVKPGDDINQYLDGVMECIKYHFKPDCIQDVSGGYDMILIDEILSNTKGLRMYSRFGAFYNVKSLNFNSAALTVEPDQTDEPDELTDADFVPIPAEFAPDESDESESDEPETDTETSVTGVQERIRSPFTGLLADRAEYRLVICNPTKLHYRDKDSTEPLAPYCKGRQLFFMQYIPDGLDLKQAIALDRQRRLPTVRDTKQLNTITNNHATNRNHWQHRAGLQDS